MWGCKVDLGQVTESVVHGEPIRSTAWTTVFADKKSVRQSEFYAAANVGLRPELMFIVHAHEYDGHEMLRYPTSAGREYDIIRTYEKDDLVEMVCSARVGELSG